MRGETQGIGLAARVAAGLGLGLLGMGLNAFPVELMPAIHLLPGLLGMAAAAVLFGPVAGLLAGLISAVPTLWLWGHPWGLIGTGLEGLALGALSRRLLPVVADALYWPFGLAYLWLSYAVASGVPPMQFAVVAVKQPLNSLLAVLAVQGLLLVPWVRVRTRGLLPPALRDVALAASLATALAFAAGFPLLVLATEEGRARYARESQELSVRIRADALVAAVGIEERLEAAVRALVMEADVLAEASAAAGALPAPARLQEGLRRLLVRAPELANAHVGDTEARILAFEPPLDAAGQPLAGRRLPDAHEVEQVLDEHRPVVTGFFLSRTGTGLPVVVAAVPVLADGQLLGYLSGALAFGELLERASLHLGVEQQLLVLDAAGAALVRDAPGQFYLRTPPVNGSLHEAVEAALHRDGTADWAATTAQVAPVQERETRRIGVASVPAPGWRVVVSQPLTGLALRVERAWLGLLGSVGIAVLLVIGAGLAFIPAVVRPVRGIEWAAARLGAGHRDARAGDATRDAPRELRHLGDSFDRMAAQLSRQLEAIEAGSRSKDEFLSIASHELKTPLTALKTQVQLLQRRLPPESGERLRRLDRQVDRLTRLVNQLLDASRAGLPPLGLEAVPCDLAEIARRVAVGLVGASPAHELRLDLQQALGNWDEVRLEQVAHNLVANAVKYAPEGGIVEVRVEQRQDGSALLEVADRGVGVEGDVDALFERFGRGERSAAFGGMGVGLYVAREIVQRHGGEIHLAPRAGGGTVATVTLPPTIPGAPPPTPADLHTPDGGP